MKCGCCNSSGFVMQYLPWKEQWTVTRSSGRKTSNQSALSAIGRRFVQLQVPQWICEINAADLEKRFIWCVRLCFKRAAEINFDLTLILTGVWCHSLFPKIDCGTSVKKLMRLVWDVLQVHGSKLPKTQRLPDYQTTSFGKLPFDKCDLVLITGSVFTQLLK